MKKKKIICLFCFVISMILIYYIGYSFGKKYSNTNTITKDWVYENNPIVYNYDDGKEAANTSELLINKNMTYILESYDMDTKCMTSIKKNIPSEFIGMNRERFVDYINDNIESFAEKNEQIKSIMLVIMDKDKIVVRKTINIIEETTTEGIDKYFVTLQENKIIVYREDKTTVFLETTINIETLDTDSIKKLEQGIPVKNISELYRILESFTT